MKKFLTAITFLIFSGLSWAQIECIDVQITPIVGSCYADNAIKVTAKDASPYPAVCKPSSGEFIIQFKGKNKDDVFKMSPYPVAAGGTAEYTLNNLESGTYQVIVRDAKTGAIVERSVTITNSYVPMNIFGLEGVAPTCTKQGGVRFRIPSGGNGPFDVTILDETGNTVLVPTQRFNRPTGNNYIEVRGTAAHPLSPNQEVRLQIKDVTTTGPNCGETRRLPITIPPEIQTPECINIKMYNFRELIVSNTDCGKHQARFRIVRVEDGKYVQEGVSNAQALYNYFTLPGTAVVRFLNSPTPSKVGKVIDISSSFDYYGFWLKDYIIEKGDVVEITIKGGKNTIKETVRFNDQIDPLTCNTKLLFVKNHSYNMGIPAGCSSSTTKELILYYEIPYGQYRDMPNVTQGGTHRYFVRWHDDNKIDVEKIEHFKLEKGPSASGPWTTVPMTNAATAGPGQARWTNRRIYLDNAGEGFYRLTYKNTNNCFETCSKVIEIKYPQGSLPSLENIWKDMSLLYGLHQETGAFMIRFNTRNYVSPLEVKVEPADGSKSITYTPKIGFLEAAQPRTITFPLINKKVFSSATDTYDIAGYTNLPSGRYRITVTDGCGQTTTKELDFLSTDYQPEELAFKKDCNVAEMIYKSKGGFNNPYINITLQKYNANGTLGQPLIRNANPFNGSFLNLLPGKYKVKLVANLSILQGKTYTTSKTWLYYWISEPGPAVTEFEKDIVVEPIEKLNPTLSPLVCDPGTGTYMIAADVTGQSVVFPLTFNLYERPNATSTGTTTSTPIKTHTYQESDNTYYHVFDGLASGKHYLVETVHVCQTVPKYISLDPSATFDPALVIDRPVPFCKGNTATVQLLGIPESIFDIRWFKLDANGNKTTAAPYKTGSKFSEPIYETTSYMAEYRIRPGIGCANYTWYTKTATVVMPPTDKPRITNGCPNDITVNASIGRCDASVSWIEPTAEPSCLGLVNRTSTHAPGDIFPIGTTKVIYTFTDVAGNTASCSFNITVKSNALKLKTQQRYTDASGNTITQLQPNQQFYYELRYQNDGSENINRATLDVKMPDATTIVSNGAPDLSGAGDGSWQHPQPTSSYNSVTKSWRFEIGANNNNSTLRLGDPERVIRIPLKVQGDCEALFAPCQNFVYTELTATYKGGPAGCPLAEMSHTASLTTTINTSDCNRQEMFCGTGQVTFKAIGGFTTYQWYDPNGNVVGNTQQYAPTSAGIYKVVKTISCHGVQFTVTETINYQTVSSTTDPIRAQAQNIGVVCPSDGSWTSQFYLCQGGAKQLTVNYQNTPFEWQMFNSSCQNQVTDPDCRVTSDDCWTTFSTDRNYSFNTAGLYRLKLTNSGCDTSFYFQIITGSLQGTRGAVKDETNFEQGAVAYNMSSSGVTYKVEIYKGGTYLRTDLKTSNRFEVDNLTAGSYRIKITSDQIAGCEYIDNPTIKKITDMSVTATFQGFKEGYCNMAKIRLQAQGGQSPYRFFIWTIDGQRQFSSPTQALASSPIAVQTGGQTYVDLEHSVSRIGEYEFLVGDTRNGAFAISNKITITPPSPHSFTISSTQEITCETHPNSGHINVMFPPGQQNFSRTLNLYKLKADGTREMPVFKSSAGGLFTGLPSGTYEVEMISQVAGTTCIYTKKPIVILPPQAPLRAYAGVVSDRSCDTQNNQYKVSVNNVSGGTPPYRYSFDGENTYVSTNIGYIGGSSNIYVKDSKDCRVTIPVTVEVTTAPTISQTPVVYRCDNGYGQVTVTVSASASQTYQYILNGSATQTLSGNTLLLNNLAPGVHTLTVYYRPSNSSTTPNILFSEDFGSSEENGCLSSDNTGLVCNNDATNFLDGQQMLTKQAPSKASWTIPTDPSGGRYLAIAGNGNGEVAYKKALTGVTLGTALTVSFDGVSLLTSSGVAPRFDVALCRADGTVLRSKTVGTAPNGSGWKKFTINFTDAEVAGFTNNTAQIRIISSGSSSYGNLGNDYAIDNVKVWQATTYCDLKVTELITVQANKQMRVEKYGAEKNVSCIGASDGQVRIRVINPPSNNVKYAISFTHTTTTTWTATTIDAQGVFTVTGLEAIQNGRIQVQDATQPNCISTVEYSIGAPTPIVPTVNLVERVRCDNTGAKIKVLATGGTPGYQYHVVSVTTTFEPTSPTPNPHQIGNIPAGTYTLVVKDANGCTTETTIDIEGVRTLTVSAEPESYCYDVTSEKKVVLTVLDGNGKYSVRRQGGNTYTFNTPIFVYPDALDAGVHTFTVTDSFGCQTQVTAEIYAPLSLQVSPTTQLYAGCVSNNHTFHLTVTGGVSTMSKIFEYSIDGGATFHVIASDPSQATVTIAAPTATSTLVQFVVTYSPNGTECRRDRFVNISYDPPRFTTDTFTTTKAICGNDNGSVIITPNDYYVGTVSHTLQIRNAVTSAVVQTPTAMAAGNYVAVLTDARGCTVSKSFTIDKIEEVRATASVTKQMGCTAADLAEITVQLQSGGTAPFVVKVLNTDTNVEATQTKTSYVSSIFTGLNYGNYQITITDANGCEKRLSALINPNSSVMNITFPPLTTCAEHTKAIISATSSGTFTATTKAYFAVYRPGIQNPSDGSVANTVATTNPNGGNDIWYKATVSGAGVVAEIPNLTPGVKYTFVAYNITTGCRYVQEATVPVPAANTLAATLSVQNVSCSSGNNGTLTYTLSGVDPLATNITWQIYKSSDPNATAPEASGTVVSIAPLGYATPQNTNTNLSAGKYLIKFIQTIGGNKCVRSFDFEIKRSAIELQVSTKETKKSTCKDPGQIWLNITGGTATYTYSYVTAGGAAPTTYTLTTQESLYVNMPTGAWDVYVRDAYGCEKRSTVTITQFDVPNVATVTTLACQAYNNTNGKIPVRITLDKIGQGAHYYSLDGSAGLPIQWTLSNQAFEVEVTPLVSHTVTVTDVNGCASSITFSTTDVIKAVAAITKPKTCATPTAEMTVTVTGGTGTYSYTLERLDNGSIASETLVVGAAVTTPATGMTITLGTASFTQAATYRISIYDSQTQDCPIVKEVTVQDPEPISLAGVTVQPYHEKCNLGLTVTGTGSIDVIMPSDSKTYTFEITSAIDITTGNTVAVTTTPTTAGTHNAIFSGLRGTPQGVKYDILITNNEGCTAQVYAVVTSPEPITFDTGVITATQYKCQGNAGLSTPQVILDTTKIKGGIPPYTTEFFDATTHTSLGNGTVYNLTNLSGGSYYVRVKDASGGCATSTASVTIAPAFDLTTLSITTTTSATCVVDEAIRIDVGTTGYIAGTPLKYIVQGVGNSIATVTTVASTTLSLTLNGSSALSGSNYTVQVINERTGCSIVGGHRIKDVNTFAIESTNPVRAVCHTDFGGITLTLKDTDLSNGDQSTAGFTYTITSVGSSSPVSLSGSAIGNIVTITTLKGGSYDIEAISNSTGCRVAKHRFIIPSNPDEISVSNVKQKVSVNCQNQDAVGELTVTGGEQEYTVTLTPISPTPGGAVTLSNIPSGAPGVEFRGLNAGQYAITLIDALGCTTYSGTRTITIDPYNSIQVASITTQVTSITCVDANNGKLKVSNVSGGTRPYSYVLVRLSATGSNIPRYITPDTEYTFEGIEPGTYRVDIVDSKNCSVTVAGTFTFANPQPITADIDENASQFYTCNAQNDGSVTIQNIAGGTGTYDVDIVRADNGQKINGHRGITATSDSFVNLPPAPKDTYYKVVITDTNGCVMTKTVSFTVVEFPDIAVNYVEREGTCDAGTNNYKDYLVVRFRNPEVDFSKITYALDGTATTTSFVRTLGNIGYIDEFDRTTRTHTIEVHYNTLTPVTGHCTASKTFDFDLYDPLTLTNTTSSATAINTIEVKAAGGTTTNLKGYTFYYNGVDRGSNTSYKINHDDPERIESNGVRIKIIQVRVEDANGCTATLTAEVPYHDIEVPNFFTPDGDGVNDVWQPKYLDNNVNARIYIFDRYGRRIANLAPGEGWDGQYDGRLMPSGDYWYVIEINDQLYDKRQFYGNFTLYR
ncbi:T9SS type B sorting domain-containing protein [Capnocytophaga sp. oral taxon 878]|uniref:T9SS type B sorting domain-containing protein n=1 Tax=Capnocytophaga sp. oral taxon 878 TaxID=1316596 RepID=UPI0020C5ABE1|nr:T9SS type B sorting domain-containing protein [Capnocytophaga sp. oral taxon 878]